MPLPTDLKQALTTSIQGEVRDDLVSRTLYSTDASLYQIYPQGVVFPQTLDDLQAVVEIAGRFKVPITARGSGSSLGGQAIGEGIIVDTARYLDRILEINPEEGTATVEPGVILTTLNRKAAPHGLMFGPDPASAERASIGGSIANNATGAHSIVYGMAADHIIEADVILADGKRTTFKALSLDEVKRRFTNGNDPGDVESALYHFALKIRRDHAEEIRQGFPQVWRRASGYSLNYLLPWSSTHPPIWESWTEMGYPPVQPEHLDLAPLLAGSEGTLAVIEKIKLRLVEKPKETILGVLTFDSVAEACDATPEMLRHNPSAVELIPGNLLELARSVPACAHQLTFVQGNPVALLVVEFAGSDAAHLKQLAGQLGTDVLIAETKTQQEEVWNVRKMGLGILNTMPGDAKSIAFVEDIAVPVEHLGEFVRGMEKIMDVHGTYAYFYAHASAGCLHIRPYLSIKDSAGKAAMRSIATQVVDLTLSLKGAVSGEHGDGFARSEWIEPAYGSTVYGLFKELKKTADPYNLLNPGKIVDAPPMDQNLRYNEAYHPQGWKPFLAFTDHEGMVGSIEMCNGAGVCRKDTGLMCPSFQVLRDEQFSPRGRANLLRALLTGGFPPDMGEKAVYEALDLCLACKGCKSECPSGVDIARLKIEFLNRYYKTHPRKLRDYLFGYIDMLAPIGSPFAGLLNTVLASKAGKSLGESLIRLSAQRQFPTFAGAREKRKASAAFSPSLEYDVLFLNDTFSKNFHPETWTAGVKALEAAGLKVKVLPVIGAGRPRFSKGFLEQAKRHAARLVAAIRELDLEGVLPVVGVEPSEVFTLRDEYLDVFPDDPYVLALAGRAWMIDEFLIRPDGEGIPRIEQVCKGVKPGAGKRVLLHGQCIQKVQPPADDGYPTGASATIAMLKAAGYEVEMVETGCCGMAGAFGYEAEHYDLSIKLGEKSLFPAVKKADEDTIIAASGTSCRSQIKHGARRVGVHPVTLIL